MADKVKLEERPKEEKIKSFFVRESVYSEDQLSKNLYEQRRFGELKETKITYSLVEALYLLEKKKMDVLEGKNKSISFDDFVRKARKIQPNFWIRYCVFRDLRSRGYIVKTALKF